MEITSLNFSKIEPIEWYDGVVRGIGFTEAAIYLIILVEWDTKSNDRTHAFLKIDKSDADFLSNSFEETEGSSKESRWNLFCERYEEIVSDYRRDIHVSSDSLQIDREIAVTQGRSRLFDIIRRYEFESTIND
jgi:hypothetical protein